MNVCIHITLARQTWQSNASPASPTPNKAKNIRQITFRPGNWRLTHSQQTFGDERYYCGKYMFNSTKKKSCSHGPKYEAIFQTRFTKSCKSLSSPLQIMICTQTSGNASLHQSKSCLLYTSDAADDLLCVDLGGRRLSVFHFQRFHDSWVRS